LEKDGENYLLGFLNADPAIHGQTMPQLDDLIIDKYLGTGSHSVAYKATYQEEAVVLKIFKNEEVYRSEIEILKSVSAIPHVTKIRKTV